MNPEPCTWIIGRRLLVLLATVVMVFLAVLALAVGTPSPLRRLLPAETVTVTVTETATPRPAFPPAPLTVPVEVVTKIVTETATVTVTETLVVEPRIYLVGPAPEGVEVRVRLLANELRVYLLNRRNTTVHGILVYAVFREYITGLEYYRSARVDDLEPNVERLVSLHRPALTELVVVVVVEGK